MFDVYTKTVLEDYSNDEIHNTSLTPIRQEDEISI
jgi:hypothetical protein